MAAPSLDEIPADVLASVTGLPGAEAVTVRTEPILGSSGAGTGGVCVLSGTARAGDRVTPFSVIRKEAVPVRSGRHAEAARDPSHWAYWRREPLAYASGLLPAGPGLRAPRCHGVHGAVMYLEDIGSTPADPAEAAYALGAWQAATPLPESVAWLSGRQLDQRLAVTRLDWARVDADPRVRELWNRRDELMASLGGVPDVVSHGDFHPANVFAAGDDVVAVDWAGFGRGPLGGDLAHLELGCLADLSEPYLAGLAGAWDSEAVRLGSGVTAALTGASRLHWMLSADIPVTEGYVEFLLTRRT